MKNKSGKISIINTKYGRLNGDFMANFGGF